MTLRCGDGDFCCQKTEMPEIAIGRGHASEQENSQTQHFLVAPVVCAILEQMLNIGGRASLVRKTDHQLTNSFTERQNKNVSSLHCSNHSLQFI